MRLLLLLLGASLLAHDALAEGRFAVPPNPAWQTECASCHIAYPPQLLPATSWQRLMSQLDRHFGADASLDTATRSEILAFIERNSGRGTDQALRITETRWFRHEHGEVAGKNLSRCESCHAEWNTERKRR